MALPQLEVNPFPSRLLTTARLLVGAPHTGFADRVATDIRK
jgi:hypothetical protein